DGVDVPFLHRLETLGDRLTRRVDDLVLLSTLDEEPPLDRRTIDLFEIVRAEAATMPAGGDAPAVEVVGASTPAALDERLISRAVRNLMANACRHAEHDVRVEVASSDHEAWIHVDDDGPGVAAEDRDLILRRFGRLDKARNSDSGGAGLGLAIVSSVARAHGGNVVVGDSPLGGARISITLPKQDSPA
ncbi:MAG TPA: ATP-binding protein, partial [Ilumatobacteraceae bacterium]|nr:ATP-binding protein [Ilumatobacteraceae bacterium]